LGAARKLHIRRRDNRWADKQYKHAHLAASYKANPFGGASHAKGIVLEKLYVIIMTNYSGIIMQHCLRKLISKGY
jgi:ribosomal protein S12